MPAASWTPKSRIWAAALLVANLVCTEIALAEGATGDDISVTVEHIDLKTADDVSLRATYYAPAMAGPAVLLLHMCGGPWDRTSWHQVGLNLAEAGMHALALDLRGYGESSGERPSTTTLAGTMAFLRNTGMSDIDAAHTFLISERGLRGQKIGIAGASCGVFLGIEAAARYENVTALALLAGPFDEAAAAIVADLGTVPILGIAAEGDGRAFDWANQIFATSANPDSRNLQFKGDAHGTDLFQVQPDLESHIVSWFKRWLLP